MISKIPLHTNQHIDSPKKKKPHRKLPDKSANTKSSTTKTNHPPQPESKPQPPAPRNFLGLVLGSGSGALLCLSPEPRLPSWGLPPSIGGAASRRRRTQRPASAPPPPGCTFVYARRPHLAGKPFKAGVDEVRFSSGVRTFGFDATLTDGGVFDDSGISDVDLIVEGSSCGGMKFFDDGGLLVLIVRL